MRDFVKSFASFTWALSVYGFSQAGNILRGWPTASPTLKATESFQKTTAAFKGQFDSIDRAIFNPVDAVQNAVIDVTLNFLNPNTFAPKTVLESSQNLLRWGLGLAGQLIPGGIIGTGGPPIGFGPVNVDDAELFHVTKAAGPEDVDPESTSQV